MSQLLKELHDYKLMSDRGIRKKVQYYINPYNKQTLMEKYMTFEDENEIQQLIKKKIQIYQKAQEKVVQFEGASPRKLRAIKLLAKEFEEGRLTDLGIRSSMDWCKIMELIVKEEKTDLLLDILKSLHKDSGHIPAKIYSPKKDQAKLKRLRHYNTNVSSNSVITPTLRMSDKQRPGQSALLPLEKVKSFQLNLKKEISTGEEVDEQSNESSVTMLDMIDENLDEDIKYMEEMEKKRDERRHEQARRKSRIINSNIQSQKQSKSSTAKSGTRNVAALASKSMGKPQKLPSIESKAKSKFKVQPQVKGKALSKISHSPNENENPDLKSSTNSKGRQTPQDTKDIQEFLQKRPEPRQQSRQHKKQISISQIGHQDDNKLDLIQFKNIKINKGSIPDPSKLGESAKQTRNSGFRKSPVQRSGIQQKRRNLMQNKERSKSPDIARYRSKMSKTVRKRAKKSVYHLPQVGPGTSQDWTQSHTRSKQLYKGSNSKTKRSRRLRNMRKSMNQSQLANHQKLNFAPAGMNLMQPSLNNSIDGIASTRKPETGLIKDFGTTTTTSDVTDLKANGSGDATINLLEQNSQNLTEFTIDPRASKAKSSIDFPSVKAQHPVNKSLDQTSRKTPTARKGLLYHQKRGGRQLKKSKVGSAKRSLSSKDRLNLSKTNLRMNFMEEAYNFHLPKVKRSRSRKSKSGRSSRSPHSAKSARLSKRKHKKRRRNLRIKKVAKNAIICESDQERVLVEGNTDESEMSEGQGYLTDTKQATSQHSTIKQVDLNKFKTSPYFGADQPQGQISEKGEVKPRKTKRKKRRGKKRRLNSRSPEPKLKNENSQVVNIQYSVELDQKGQPTIGEGTKVVMSKTRNPKATESLINISKEYKSEANQSSPRN